jgi:hypothetical protein
VSQINDSTSFIAPHASEEKELQRKEIGILSSFADQIGALLDQAFDGTKTDAYFF